MPEVLEVSKFIATVFTKSLQDQPQCINRETKLLPPRYTLSRTRIDHKQVFRIISFSLKQVLCLWCTIHNPSNYSLLHVPSLSTVQTSSEAFSQPNLHRNKIDLDCFLSGSWSCCLATFCIKPVWIPAPFNIKPPDVHCIYRITH